MHDHHAADREGSTPVRAADQQRGIRQAVGRADLSAEELWLRYFGMGGMAEFLDVDAFVHGLGGLPAVERDVLAETINERLDELASAHRAPYSRPCGEDHPHPHPFAALMHLLDGAHLAPPERLPAVARLAGRTLGLTVRVHLADDEETALHPFDDEETAFDGTATTAAAATGGLAVATTVAGAAFHRDRVLTERTGTPRLWVPLRDGVTRLGVLEVVPHHGEDLDGPGLRGQCRWLADLLGRLVTLASRHGDAVDRIRHRGAREPGGELVRALLPPATAGVDRFVVTAHAGAGAFDYALSETTATLVVLGTDDPRGGLLTATALAAHRTARRTGHAVGDQAAFIAEAVTEAFGAGARVTAVLAELDLLTGRLCHVTTGHAHPVVVRADGSVEALTPDPGEAVVHPGDWLVLRAADAPLGGPRFTGLLRHDARAGRAPARAAREHGATVLLAGWPDEDPPGA